MYKNKWLFCTGFVSRYKKHLLLMPGAGGLDDKIGSFSNI